MTHLEFLNNKLKQAQILEKSDYETEIKEAFHNSEEFKEIEDKDEAFEAFKQSMYFFEVEDFNKITADEIREFVLDADRLILTAIDTESLETLKELKKLRNQIEKISDRYFLSTIAIDKAQ